MATTQRTDRTPANPLCDNWLELLMQDVQEEGDYQPTSNLLLTLSLYCAAMADGDQAAAEKHYQALPAHARFYREQPTPCPKGWDHV
jgi:hypothetical protein